MNSVIIGIIVIIIISLFIYILKWLKGAGEDKANLENVEEENESLQNSIQDFKEKNKRTHEIQVETKKEEAKIRSDFANDPDGDDLINQLRDATKDYNSRS